MLNASGNIGLYIGIQISMWIAVVTQIGLLIPDLIYTIRTRNTMHNKYLKFLIWFLCSAAWIVYAILMIYDNLPIEEVIGLSISEGVNLICLFIIYGIKINNISIAKKRHMTEEQYCTYHYLRHIAKQELPKIVVKAKKDLSKYFSEKEVNNLIKKAKKLHYLLINKKEDKKN